MPRAAGSGRRRSMHPNPPGSTRSCTRAWSATAGRCRSTICCAPRSPIPTPSACSTASSELFQELLDGRPVADRRRARQAGLAERLHQARVLHPVRAPRVDLVLADRELVGGEVLLAEALDLRLGIAEDDEVARGIVGLVLERISLDHGQQL